MQKHLRYSSANSISSQTDFILSKLAVILLVKFIVTEKKGTQVPDLVKSKYMSTLSTVI